MQASAVSAGDFVWLLGSLCQLNRLAFDAQLILQRFPAPHTVRDFLEAARSLGFRTGEGDIGKPNFPCVGFLKGEPSKPAILCVGALLVMRNDGFSIGMLVAFQMFASRMSQPMLRLAGL